MLAIWLIWLATGRASANAGTARLEPSEDDSKKLLQRYHNRTNMYDFVSMQTDHQYSSGKKLYREMILC